MRRNIFLTYLFSAEVTAYLIWVEIFDCIMRSKVRIEFKFKVITQNINNLSHKIKINLIYKIIYKMQFVIIGVKV